MKRLLLALLVGASQVTAMADGYQYLAFQASDNTMTTVSVSGLVLTVDGTRLVATTADGDQWFLYQYCLSHDNQQWQPLVITLL